MFAAAMARFFDTKVLVWLGQLGPYPQLNLTPALLLTHVALDAYAFSSTSMFETNPYLYS